MNAEMRVEMAKVAVALWNVGRMLGEGSSSADTAWDMTASGYGALRISLGLNQSYIFEEELKIVQDSGDVIG